MQSTLKKLPSIAFASLLVFFGSILTASAYTWERLPTGYFIGESVTYTVSDFNYTVDCVGAPLDGYWWIDVYSQDGNSDFIHELTSEPLETERTHEFIITEYEYADNDYIQAGIVCSDSEFNQTSFLEFEINETPPYLFRLEHNQSTSTPTTTPPIGEDKRIDNLIMFVLFWFTTFGGTVILVNKFT